jgi:hypothetical protein
MPPEKPFPMSRLFIARHGKEVNNMLEAMVGSCAGLDVHRRQVTCTVIREGSSQTREYAAFHRELKELARWLQRQIAPINGQIVAAMKPYEEEWKLLQTISPDLML